MGSFLIFLLSSFVFGVIALLIVYLGNKIFNQIQKDNYKAKKELENQEQMEEN